MPRHISDPRHGIGVVLDQQISAACSSVFAQSECCNYNALDLVFPDSVSFPASSSGCIDDVQFFDFGAGDSRAMVVPIPMLESSLSNSIGKPCISLLSRKHDRDRFSRAQQSWPDWSETGWKSRGLKYEQYGNAGGLRQHYQGFGSDPVRENFDGGGLRHHHQRFGSDPARENLDGQGLRHRQQGFGCHQAREKPNDAGLRRGRQHFEKARSNLNSRRENESGARLDVTAAIKTSKHLFAGAVSAIVSRTLVAPLERIKLEYIVRGAKGDVLRTVQKILEKEGVRGFWKGNLVNLIRTAPFKSVNFYAYDTFRKHMMLLSGKNEVSNLEKFAAGAAAGVTASIICFPMDTIRTRMIAPGGEAFGNIVTCFRYMIEKEGPLSLYAGLLPALVSMAPSGAVFYGVYDILKTSYLSSPKRMESTRKRFEAQHMNFVESRKESGSIDQLQLGPMRTLLYGAIAGACAETVTYPLEVIRRQLQLQSAANRIGMIATVKALVEKGGVGALYAGLLPSTFQRNQGM
ncbi:hypothetical protein O6H91_01G075700 [Diphasiastrum complanatum]|uniref:Uncharacterized protein n=1 Tax=Diphasiastrum complanatum TaxID=34168 RepID=A0ACC2ES96_DIPCM|nr:hypothetical protein O6H91_01G075700 [Diphasiastrum complanatum]